MRVKHARSDKVRRPEPIPKVLLKTTGCLFFRNIPIALKGHFKAACAKKGESMQSAIECLMETFIRNTSKFKIKDRHRHEVRKRQMALIRTQPNTEDVTLYEEGEET